jgi:large subunit ribosomal protein L9
LEVLSKFKIMAKRMQVILNQTVSKLGLNGDLVEVAPGYARNYLLPQKLAFLATPGAIKQAEFRKEKERQRLLAEKQEAETRKAALEKLSPYTIAKQEGENEAIFGTVTSQDVAVAILETAKLEIDRRGITVPDISQLGIYKAQIKLHPEVSAEIEIKVVAQ